MGLGEASLTWVGNIAPPKPTIPFSFKISNKDSLDLFSQYLTKGVGSYPMIVGYENQVIEFATQYPAQWQGVKNNIRILYPVPTVWSTQPLISLNEKGNKLIQALKQVLTNSDFQAKILKNLQWFVIYKDPQGMIDMVKTSLEQMKGPIERMKERQKQK